MLATLTDSGEDVLQRADSYDVLGRSAYHLVRFVSDGDDRLFLFVVSHNARLVEHNALAADGNDDIGCSQIYSYIKCHFFLLFIPRKRLSILSCKMNYITFWG